MKRTLFCLCCAALLTCCLVGWGALAPSYAVGLVPAEECGCPPDPDDFYVDTYGICNAPDAALSVNLQGWSRLGLAVGMAPDSQGYIRRLDTDLQTDIQKIRVYGTRVDLLVDLTGEGMGRECWAGDRSSFSILNLADGIAEAVEETRVDGVLLKVPVAWVVAFSGAVAYQEGGAGVCGELLISDENTRRGRRVRNLIHRLGAKAPFHPGGKRINLLVTRGEDTEHMTAECLLTFRKHVEKVLIELPEPEGSSCRREMDLLNRSCRLDLRTPEKKRVIPVITPTILSEGGITDDFFKLAMDLGFRGLAMDVTAETGSAFLAYNAARLKEQDDFFGGLVWRTGLANTLCWKRDLIRWAACLLGSALVLVALLAALFCPVRQVVGRFPRVLLGVGLLFVGLIWLLEAVRPTVNNWTNEAVALMLVTVCIALVLVWLRNRQRERFP